MVCLTRTEQADISAELEGVGKRIRAKREAKGMTQRAFAQAVGQSQAVVWTWEAGKFLPHVENLLLICKTLEVSPNELLGWRDAHGAAPKEREGAVKRSAVTGRRTLDLRGRMAPEEKPKRRRGKKPEGERNNIDPLHKVLMRPELMTMSQLKKSLCWPPPKDGCANCSSPCRFGMELERRKAAMAEK